MTNEGFTLRVLRVFADIDLREDLFWRVDGDTATFFATCSDVFEWGTADAEKITPDNIDSLEQAVADICAAGGASTDLFHVGSLFAARIRGVRPQGAAYPSNQALWPLFDACGPEREIGLGNPHRPGERHGKAA